MKTMMEWAKEINENAAAHGLREDAKHWAWE